MTIWKWPYKNGYKKKKKWLYENDYKKKDPIKKRRKTLLKKKSL